MEQQIDRCGDCHSCCKSFGALQSNQIQLIDLGIQYEWGRCNKLCDNNRCTIYETKPQSCSDYECVYVESDLPVEYIPERVGFVTNLRTYKNVHYLDVTPNESRKHNFTSEQFFRDNYRNIITMKETAEEIWSVTVPMIRVCTAAGEERFYV